MPHTQPPTPPHTPPTSSRVDDDCTPAEHTSAARDIRPTVHGAHSGANEAARTLTTSAPRVETRNQQPCDRTTLGWVADSSRTKAPNRERNRGGRSAADDKRDLKADTRAVIFVATQERTVTSTTTLTQQHLFSPPTPAICTPSPEQHAHTVCARVDSFAKRRVGASGTGHTP